MTRRMAMAVIALLGLFVATYLSLHAFGVIGQLACTAVQGCEQVQSSRWSRFLGFPVAVWGAGYYAAVLSMTIVSLLPRYEDSRGVSLGLLLLTGWGFVFSGWLTALEAFVIHYWCQWCVISATLATALFVLAILDWRATPPVGAEVVEDEPLPVDPAR
jgi:uncharacterized membrane protein